MISFMMIIFHEIADTAPQPIFTKEDHLLHTLFLDRSYESFRAGIQIRASGQQPYKFDSHICQHVQKLLRIQWIAVMNQMSLPLEETVSHP